MSLRIGDRASDFRAQTTQGPISFHQWLANSQGYSVTRARRLGLKVGDVETFKSRKSAAKRAAAEQRSSNEAAVIEYKDEKGVWHEEHSYGDPPETDVN